MPPCCIAIECFNTRKDRVSLSLARSSPICEVLDEYCEKHSLNLQTQLDLATLILLKTTLKPKDEVIA